MDLTLADVTGLPGVSVGDEVILLGTTDGLSVDAREHASLSDTILYEILWNLQARAEKVRKLDKSARLTENPNV